MEPRAKPSEMDSSIRELVPYLDSYWRDYDCDSVYAAAVVAIHVDQAGGIVGQSWHVNGPTADFTEGLVRDLLAAADGEVA